LEIANWDDLEEGHEVDKSAGIDVVVGSAVGGAFGVVGSAVGGAFGSAVGAVVGAASGAVTASVRRKAPKLVEPANGWPK
jgi:outer membrane lipoprotein SlyB